MTFFIPPNPSYSSTNINYIQPLSSIVQLDIYDITGTKLVCLINEFQNKGDHSINWSGEDGKGNILFKGIYFIQLKTAKETVVMKVVKSN